MGDAIRRSPHYGTVAAVPESSASVSPSGNGFETEVREPAPNGTSIRPLVAATGMPFHWAMAFAILVFVAMSVAFWCGHSYSVAVMEKFCTSQPSIESASDHRTVAPTAPRI